MHSYKSEYVIRTLKLAQHLSLGIEDMVTAVSELVFEEQKIYVDYYY